MIKSSDGKTVIDGMNFVQGAASVRHDGNTLYTEVAVIGADHEPRFFSANQIISLGVYDKPATYIMQKMELASNFTYFIGGQCAPVGSTVYFTRDSDISNIRELKDHIHASVDSDDEGKFNVSLRGHDGIMYAWTKNPTTLDFNNLGKLRCNINKAIPDEEDAIIDGVIYRQLTTQTSIKKICEDCLGTGDGGDLVDVDCPVCGGTGEVETDEGECQDCEGRGYDIIQVDCETCSGTGEVEYTGDAVWYNYGGIIAPDINTVWTDELKETYKFAMIDDDRNGNLELYLTPDTPTKKEESTCVWNFSGGYKYYSCDKYSDSWSYRQSVTYATTRYIHKHESYWLSEELYNLDGTIYEHEVTGEGVYSVGGEPTVYAGFSLYNVEPSLPTIPVQTLKPYAYIFYNSSEAKYYLLLNTSNALRVSINGYLRNTEDVVETRYTYEEGIDVAWTRYMGVQYSPGQISYSASNILWTNFDILNEDGSVFMEETQPVPLHKRSYNGVELPALPEWDKETYPYAVISNYTTYGGDDGVTEMTNKRLRLFQEPYVLGSKLFTSYAILTPENLTNPEAGTTYAYYVCKEEENYAEWHFVEEVEMDGSSENIGAPKWSNYDVYLKDGTLYLAASDPVPVHTGPARACVDCSSTGKVDAEGPTCETCSGTGVVDHYETKCSTCGGDGAVASSLTCNVCNTTGEVEYEGDVVWYKYPTPKTNDDDPLTPDINTVWTDELKETYPYAYLFQSGTSAGVTFYTLRLTKEPFSRPDTSSNWICQNGYINYRYLKTDDVWTYESESSADYSLTSISTSYWFSYDITEADGTAVYTYVEPELYTDTVILTCSNCNGKLYVDGPEVTCSVCDGFGYIVTKPTAECDNCEGSGYVEDSKCGTCKGIGVTVGSTISSGNGALYTFEGTCPNDLEQIKLSCLPQNTPEITMENLASKINVTTTPADGRYSISYGAGASGMYNIVIWGAYDNSADGADQSITKYKFNDVELPPPICDMTASSTHPYCVLVAMSDIYAEKLGYQYRLLCSNSAVGVRYPHLYVYGYSYTPAVHDQVLVDGRWIGGERDLEYQENNEIRIRLYPSEAKIVWSSHDIYHTDGTLYFEGSSYSVVTATPDAPMITINTETLGDDPNYDPSCLSADTLITMADGSFKRMDELRVGDMLMSEDGSATEIYRIGRGHHNPYHILYTFDDGTIIDETHDHRFFNVDQGFWQRLKNWEIGERAKCQNGSTVCLASIDRIDEPKEMFGIWTESGSYYANGLLSGVATCNQDLLADATAEMAIDMLLSADEHQLLELLDFGGALP